MSVPTETLNTAIQRMEKAWRQARDQELLASRAASRRLSSHLMSEPKIGTARASQNLRSALLEAAYEMRHSTSRRVRRAGLHLELAEALRLLRECVAPEAYWRARVRQLEDQLATLGL